MSSRLLKVRRSKIVKGEYGLFAGKNFERGERISYMWHERIPLRDVCDYTHIMWVGNKAYLILDQTKYANHSDKPNATVKGFFMYARKRIEKGEEITWYYGKPFSEGLRT